jgi:NhaP-type Na+/H+ or K+/H+ antiporter
MIVLLIFAVTLLLAVMLSGIAQRSVLSTAVLFLMAGFVMGKGVLGIIAVQPDDPLVTNLAQLALFTVLFTDGMRIGIRDFASSWRLPGRALLLGFPLTLVGTALAAHFVAGLPWTESFLLGAVLSPTDPVFAAAIVGRETVPLRLRRLLNVESGLNDGLALPLVLILLHMAGGSQARVSTVLAELALGVALGILVPWVVLRIERLPFLSFTTTYEPLNAVAIGLLVLALASVAQANIYLAAFAAGVTVASVGAGVRDAFRGLGESVTELLKLSSLLVFGALISPDVLGLKIGLGGYAFAFLALVVVRSVALGIALIGSQMPTHEWITVAWFGPKGFASMIYALLVLKAGLSQSDELFHLVALVVAGSIIAHSSTDTLLARWYREQSEESASAPERGGASQGSVAASRDG